MMDRAGFFSNFSYGFEKKEGMWDGQHIVCR
jgi:hypothetical protein